MLDDTTLHIADRLPIALQITLVISIRSGPEVDYEVHAYNEYMFISGMLITGVVCSKCRHKHIMIDVMHEMKHH